MADPVGLWQTLHGNVNLVANGLYSETRRGLLAFRDGDRILDHLVLGLTLPFFPRRKRPSNVLVSCSLLAVSTVVLGSIVSISDLVIQLIDFW